MKKSILASAVSIWLLLSIAVLTPSAFATGNKQVTVPKSFGSSRIDNWRVVDRDTLIFEIFGQDDLVAEVFPGCTGLRFATTLAIRDRAFELSRGSTLLLPGGERCSIKSLTRLETEEGSEAGNKLTDSKPD